ncbi:hypothetical protein GCM10025870_08240 [Agromyces marinus]|uniref:Uncharacterized protein n=1 Tax=Agromyces marinus TaxID=1389020 RepID=A0ABM8GZ34_9MICO|nr:hypothetical protein GCM10025870_08240 [Agromyces marinus]
MISSEGTEAIVAFEDDSPAILFDTIPGGDVPLWPLLRIPLSRVIAEAELNTVAVRRRDSKIAALGRIARRSLPNPAPPGALREGPRCSSSTGAPRMRHRPARRTGSRTDSQRPSRARR